MAAASRAVHSQLQHAYMHGIQSREVRSGWVSALAGHQRPASWHGHPSARKGWGGRGTAKPCTHSMPAMLWNWGCSSLLQANPPLTSCRGGEGTRAVERNWVPPTPRLYYWSGRVL